MLIVLLVVCCALVALGIYICNNTCTEIIGGGIGVIGGVLAVVVIAAMIVLGVQISHAPIMDDKIALYEETNAEIDSQIADMVTQYKDYEASTLSDLKTDSAITLVNLYPELKSDELVQSQMEIYQSNKKHILSLKEDKLSLKPKRWWLYFGG